MGNWGNWSLQRETHKCERTKTLQANFLKVLFDHWIVVMWTPRSQEGKTAGRLKEVSRDFSGWIKQWKSVGFKFQQVRIWKASHTFARSYALGARMMFTLIQASSELRWYTRNLSEKIKLNTLGRIIKACRVSKK